MTLFEINYILVISVYMFFIEGMNLGITYQNGIKFLFMFQVFILGEIFLFYELLQSLKKTPLLRCHQDIVQTHSTAKEIKRGVQVEARPCGHWRQVDIFKKPGVSGVQAAIV